MERERLWVDWPGVFLVYCANGLDGISINVGAPALLHSPTYSLTVWDCHSLSPCLCPGNIRRQPSDTGSVSHIRLQPTNDAWPGQSRWSTEHCYLWCVCGVSNAVTPEADCVYLWMVMSLPRPEMVSALTRLRGKDNIRDTSPASADQNRSGARWKGVRVLHITVICRIFLDTHIPEHSALSKTLADLFMDSPL